MNTLKDSINLMYELCKYLFIPNNKLYPSGKRILKDDLAFIRLIKKNGITNPIVEIIQEELGVCLPYKSLFETHCEDFKGLTSRGHDDYFDLSLDISVDYRRLLYGYSKNFIYILKYYDLKLYIRETINKKHGSGSYDYLFKNFKRERDRCILMEDTGCLKFLETVGLLWDKQLREVTRNRIESGKN